MGNSVVPGKEGERRGSDRADDVAEIDERPGTQQRPDRDAAARVSHHHERIAGEKLGAADDHKNHPQRKDQSGQQSRKTPGQVPGAGQHAQDQDGQGIATGLRHPRNLTGYRHGGRQQRIDRVTG